MNDTKRENVLKKLRAILDKAESTTFGPERDAFLAKADELMLRFAVEEHELVMEGKTKEVKPEVRTFDVCRTTNPLREQLTDLIVSIVFATRGKVVFYNLRSGAKDDRPIQAKVVAFPSDLDYIEMLHTSLVLQLANQMEPKPDPSKDVLENMTALKAAGLKWNRIFEVLEVRAAGETEEYTKDERRLVAQWRRWMKDQGREDELKGIHPKSYRRSYAQGFVTEVQSRFHKQEQERKEREARDSGGGSALVLRDRDKVVGDAFREMFPNLTTGPRRDDGKMDPNGWRRGREAGAKADLSRPGTRIGQRPGLPGA